jgi:hypothetical protein
VQFRHRARLGRSMKLYCRNLIVDVTSGRVLTSFAPFASHAKSCEYFNHGPYRQLNSVRGTKVLFVPNDGGAHHASVLSAGFVSVERDGTPPASMGDDQPKGHGEQPQRLSTRHSRPGSSPKEIATTHVPGFSFTNLDLKQHERTRLGLMNLSLEELTGGIRAELHRARIPPAIAANRGRIVDWILQLHDHDDVAPILEWASSSSSPSSSFSSLSPPPSMWEDDASSSSSNASNGNASRRDSIDSNSSHSESSVASA